MQYKIGQRVAYYKVTGLSDPSWKCLIDGKEWRRSACEHDADDQDAIIEQVRQRVS